jgi:hypothetical protein
MRRRLRLISTLALVLCIAAGIAWAQEVTTGTIQGTAKDPQGAPLPGVTVTISSVQGTKSATTDQDGKFRFSYLTAGAYSLKAMLEGFNTVERQNLTVSLAASVNLEIILSAGLSEKIEVVAQAPVVDLSTATTGATISSQLMNSVPLGRTFSSAVALAPGVVASGIDAANPSIGGASGLENTYVVDGVNIGNAGYGSAGSYSITFGSLGTGVNFDYIQEVQVKTGGYEPEFGEALGGFVNLVTKSGGNEVKGSLYSYLQSSKQEAPRVHTDRINAVSDPLSFQSYDFGVDVGGPIVKNKAFWYAAFDPTFTTRTRRTANAISSGQGFYHELSADRNTYNYAGNVKWFLNSKHTFSFSAFGDPAQGPSGAQRSEAVANRDASLKFSSIDFGGHNAIGRWTGELGKNLFAEGSVSYHRDRFSETPEHNLNSGVIDSSTAGVAPIQAGGVGFFEDATSQRYTYQLKLNSFIHAKGEHSLRYGVEYQDLRYDHSANYSGAPGLKFANAAGDSIVASTGYIWQVTPGLFTISRIRSGSLDAKTHADYVAGFVSDTWSPTKWLKLMAGLRWEQETLFGNLSSFRWRDNWAPRLHATVDPTRDNKSKLSFAYGRFFGKVPNDLAVRALSSEVTYSVDYPLSSVDLSDPNNPRIIGPQSGAIAFGDQATVIDPNSKLTFQDEYVASLEREVVPSLNVGVTYMHRKLGRTLEDVALSPYSAAVDSGVFGNYYITNPSPALGFPKPSRKYDAVTFKADKRFNDRWQVMSSYTWSRLRGNYEGYYRRDNGQSDPFITSLFDFPYLKDPNIFKHTSEDGLLPNDRTHVFNAFGSYRFAGDLNLGMSVTIQSGTPITKLGYNKAYETPGEIALEARGASGRTPTTGDIGVHADYPLRVASGSKVLLVLDIFNLLNHQKAVEVDQNAELNGIVNPDPSLHGPNGEDISCPTCANEDFGHATVYQSPFAMRFAARLVY